MREQLVLPILTGLRAKKCVSFTYVAFLTAR
jgi:hypothetical protein